MTKISIPLQVFLGLLMVVSAIELAFVSSTVAYLAKAGKRTYGVTSNGQTIQVPGLPADLSVNQGHTSNGAAGTGLIVIGWCGCLALWLRGRPGLYHKKSVGGTLARAWYRLWLLLNVPALLLTLGALAYVFAVTNQHQGQAIDLATVRQLGLAAGDGGVQYPLLEWTPQGWFGALRALDLVSGEDRDGLDRIYKIARGWQYNLIAFFLVQLAETVLALYGAQARRKEERRLAPAATAAGSEKHDAYNGQPGLFNNK